jgi:arylsulfatase A-like enzyme
MKMELMMNRRDYLKMTGAAGVAMSAFPQRAAAKSGKRPNIVYLFSDEHRYQSMSFTEMPAVKTPNMARMAKAGTSFQHAISNNPVCVPHRCMLLSGQWPHRTGAVDNQGGLGPTDKTLGHIFSDAGYRTGYTGKWHAGGFAHKAGFDWHMLWGDTNDHWNSYWQALHTGDQTKHPCKTYQPITMTNQAIDFMNESAGGDQPFFLMVAWNPPHAIFTDAPEEKKALYPDEGALPWRGNADESGKKKWWKNYQGYHAHITVIDEEIGRVFQALEKNGQLENTIVIYSADHGSMMNSHGKGNKRHPQDESCRVPFLVSGSGVPAGQVRREPFGTIDVVPTLCGLAGINVPAFCDGLNFSPNVYNRPGIADPKSQLLMHVAYDKPVRKGELVPSKEAFLEFHNPFYRGVRSDRYTFAVGIEGDWLLWDNEKDPLQQNNLVNDPAYADVKEMMRAELDGWLAKAELPFLNEAYHNMSLPDSICQQALDRSAALPMHHIITRLKLSPEQYAAVPEIRARYYTEKGRPKDKAGGGKAWARAEQGVLNDVRGILDATQLKKFDAMLAEGK